MTEDATMEELESLYNEVDELKKKLELVSHNNKTYEEIIMLQRKTIEHLKMIADDRRVTINQMNEERWSVRRIGTRKSNIEKSFVEESINDLDMEFEMDEMTGLLY